MKFVVDAFWNDEFPVTVNAPMLVEEALEMKPEVKVWRLLQLLVVVVPKPREKLPVALLYASGYVAESDVLEILLLKEVQSPRARKPFCDPVPCWILSVFEEKRSGLLMSALVSAPVPLPVKMPPRVVDAVPPCATPSVPVKRLKPIEVVATIDPFAFVERIELGIEVMANAEDVAFAKVDAPLTVSVPPKSPLPLVVKLPTTVEDDCERKPEVKELSPENHDAPETERRVEEAFVKMLLPLQMLLLERRVDDAAVMVAVPPRAIVMPLMVRFPDPVRRLFPMVEVATTTPCALVVRSAFGVPEMVRLVVEAVPK